MTNFLRFYHLSKQKMTLVNSYFIIALGFCIPLPVALVSFISLLILILWVYEGNFKMKWREIKSNPLLQIIGLYVLLHIIGLLWTDNIDHGLSVLSKQWKYFLLLPLLLTSIRKRHLFHYIAAFVGGMILSEILSYLIWFDVIPHLNPKATFGPTPFRSHIIYSPLLAFTAYLLLVYTFLYTTNKYYKILGFGLFILTTINLFMLDGRAGHIAFFISLFIFLLQWSDKHFLYKLVRATLIVSTLFVAFFQYNASFNNRISEVVSETSNYQEQKNTSVGLRIRFALNSLQIMKDHPVIGVGTGDFADEHRKVDPTLLPMFQENPHNMYALIGAQFGVMGLVILLLIFFTQLRLSVQQPHSLKYIGCLLPLFFMIISLSETYLYLHQTSVLFVYFSAILYKNYRT